MNVKSRNRRLAIVLVLAAAASGLVGAAHYRTTRDVPLPVRAAPQTPMVGVATGEYDHGLPVYRLPPVQVTVNKSDALAAIAREEALAAIVPEKSFTAK